MVRADDDGLAAGLGRGTRRLAGTVAGRAGGPQETSTVMAMPFPADPWYLHQTWKVPLSWNV